MKPKAFFFFWGDQQNWQTFSQTNQEKYIEDVNY